MPQPDEPALMTSDETGRMIVELLRYCRGERDGVSILVSGQRGAGKTTLVKMALQQIMEAGDGLIPLPIFLHGPTIIDPDANTSPPNGRSRQESSDTRSGMNGSRSVVQGARSAADHHGAVPRR
jgi:hypothetical protein